METTTDNKASARNIAIFTTERKYSMIDFTYTHLIYFEDLAGTEKPGRRIVNRFPSLVAARSMLSVLFDSRHDKNKTLLNDTVTITKNGEIVKRWTIAETSLETDLKLR